MAEDEPRQIKIRRVDFYADDWIAGTVGLSHEERSVYISVCAAIWSNGGPVEETYVQQICRNGRSQHFERGLARLIAKGKVTRSLSPDSVATLSQNRALTELHAAQLRTEKASVNGIKGNNIRWKGVATPSLASDPQKSLPDRRPRSSPSKKESKRIPSSSSDREVAARAPEPYGGADHARDLSTDDWKPLGSALGHPSPPPQANRHDRRVCEHLEFLRFHGGPQDVDLYLAAQNSGDPDDAERMFALTEDWMTEDTRNSSA